MIGLFQSAERAAYLDFSSPLMTIDTNLYVKESLNVDSIEALGGIPVGVIKNDYAEGFLSKNYSGLKLRTFPGSKEVIDNAVNGKLAAFVLDFQNATYLLSQRNALTKFQRAATLYTGKLRAGVRKGDVQLVNFINQGFKKISRKERKAIYDRWGSYSPEPLIARNRYEIIGGTLTLFKNRDSTDLADKVITLLIDNELRKELGNRQCKYVANESWDVAAKRTMQNYGRIIF